MSRVSIFIFLEPGVPHRAEGEIAARPEQEMVAIAFGCFGQAFIDRGPAEHVDDVLAVVVDDGGGDATIGIPCGIPR
jgi:hypothetical protein